ncbi:uncharacterized protein LOC120356457 [Nilaparvata lugens]|uniref:uncharacterized protein LOC120356457 n=1 Tax=Nilaparvata lugens TaxID=108931 RepID=UPI00193D3B2C|nr:uncharacterized protein LOC120356457 [Nilaparvata lugens]
MEDTIDIVAEFVKANNLETPFKDGRPGKDWYYGFLHCHPSLSVKKPELLQSSRKNAWKRDIFYNFYSELNKVINDCGLNEEKAAFVFNCNESGFNMDPSHIKAIGEKGSPSVRVSGGSGRESTTVLATVSADGNYLPPFIVSKGLAVQPRWIPTEDSYPGTLYAASSNGWMEEEHYHQWFIASLSPHVNQLRVAKKL